MHFRGNKPNRKRSIVNSSFFTVVNQEQDKEQDATQEFRKRISCPCIQTQRKTRYSKCVPIQEILSRFRKDSNSDADNYEYVDIPEIQMFLKSCKRI